MALSGGPDSTALLVAVCELRRDVVAAHFDHALRADSHRDLEHVAALCARAGIRLITARRRRPLPPGSLQAAARAVRYEFLERAAATARADHVLLGHTADDVVEGVLLHLLRGSGLAGLRGVPPGNGLYRRPLLDTWRRDVLAFLAARGVLALDDPANRDTERFARARVRFDLLPRLEADRPGLTGSLRAAAAAAVRLQAAAESAAAGLSGERGQLRGTARAVRLEYYRGLFGEQPALSRRQLLAMDRLALAGPTGSGLDLPRGRRFRVSAGYVSMDVQPAAAPSEPTLEARPCPGCEEPGAAHFPAGTALSLGRRSPGLAMRPRPHGRTRKLQDVLVDAKLPRHLRDSQPLVFADGRLAWVPGIAEDAFLTVPRGRTESPLIHATVDGAPNGRW